MRERRKHRQKDREIQRRRYRQKKTKTQRARETVTEGK